MSIKYATFIDFASFSDWKTKEERNSQSLFVQQCGTKKASRIYYSCNREGNYQPVANRKRALKSQGTCKLGETCTAYMKVIKNVTDGTMSVEHCLDHSHDISISHLRIPNQ